MFHVPLTPHPPPPPPLKYPVSRELSFYVNIYYSETLAGPQAFLGGGGWCKRPVVHECEEERPLYMQIYLKNNLLLKMMAGLAVLFTLVVYWLFI